MNIEINAIAAIFGITILTAIAMFNGIDGILYMAAIAIISGIGGYPVYEKFMQTYGNAAITGIEKLKNPPRG